jgi:hypothetical protein
MTLDDPNPYASPRCAEPAIAADSEAQGPSAWRDGDVLVVRRNGAVLPRACLKSNRSYLIAQEAVQILPDGWRWLLPSVVVVPLLGLVFHGVALGLLIRAGRVGRIVVWVGLGRDIVAGVCRGVSIVLVVAGTFFAFLAPLLPLALLFLLALGCTGLGAPLWVLGERVLLGLRFEMAEPDLIRIHGAHPEYLKRLPPLQRIPE